jgi:hypothetical protein
LCQEKSGNHECEANKSKEVEHGCEQIEENRSKPGETYQDGKNLPNGHKMYQMAIKYTKWPQNMDIYRHKIHQMK